MALIYFFPSVVIRVFKNENKTKQKPHSAVHQFVLIGQGSHATPPEGQDLHFESNGMNIQGTGSCVLQSPFPLQALGKGSEEHTDFLGKYNNISHIFFSIHHYLE